MDKTSARGSVLKPEGIFVGLSTVDIIYTLDEFPSPNRKVTARSQQLLAGGPATNAAITFSHLGGSASLVTPIGMHPLSGVVREDAECFQIELLDLSPQSNEVPPVSSLWVNRLGQRSVVSINTSRTALPPVHIDTKVLAVANVLMVDGHAMTACLAWASAAKSAGVDVVLDGGSWKNGTELLLENVTVAICSADFLPPGCSSEDQTFDYLRAHGVTNIAITHGANPVRFASATSMGSIAVPAVQAVDTAGAGDIFHGAFCFHFSIGYSFEAALRQAAAIAAKSCLYPGTRTWMDHRQPDSA